MKYSLLLVVCFLLARTLSIEADTPSPRYNGGCQLLSGHVYCFGGANSRNPPIVYYSDLYVLDLSKSIPDINTPNWVQLASGFEPNSGFVMAPSSDTSFFIVGGTGAHDGQPLSHTFSSYNINSNNWTSYANSNASSSWVQTLGTSGTPNNGFSPMNPDHKLYLFGGRTDTTIGAKNVTYPTPILVLDMITGTWSGVASINRMPPRFGHQVIYLNTHMVMVGGQIATSNAQGVYTLTPADMTVLPYFDTFYLSWYNVTVTGTAPSPRSDFTLTPFSKFSASAFLYGGIDANNQPCADTMYKLSFTGRAVNTWTVLTSNSLASASDPGPLYGHSTIAYNAYTMLIFNGVDKNGDSTNNVRVYDIQGQRWHDSFSTNGIYSSPVSNSTSTSGSSLTRFQLSQAVAGGVGVGGLVFFGLIGFLLCRHVEKYQRLAWATEDGVAAHGTKQEVVEEPLLEMRPNLHHGHYADQQHHLSATHVSSDHYQDI